ncbi:MAG: CARDB domain-containing protein [Candidatus Sumerlaeaceae bacterium]
MQANNIGSKVVHVDLANLPELAGQLIQASLSQCKTTRQGLRCKFKTELSLTNNGLQNAGLSVVVFYLSDDAVISPDDIPLKSWNVKSLKMGAVKRKNLNISLPIGLTAGGKSLLAIADSGSQVSEQNEFNNVITLPIQ